MSARTHPSPPCSKAPGARATSGEPASWLKRATRPVERILTKLSGSAALNPFYQSASLAVFLWLVVAISGVYLTFFYQFDFDGSYRSVAKMEGQVVARVIRAIHKYASGTALLVSLLHAYRMLAQGHFRGARWLAWVSGIAMLPALWLAGVTGYALIWDERAQVIATYLAQLLAAATPWGPAFAVGLLEARVQDESWLLMLFLLFAHISFFAIAALLFWNHILRVQRPRWLPPQPWMLGLVVVLVAVGLIAPAGMLPPAASMRLPGTITIDPFYLFFLAARSQRASAWLWVAVGITGFALATLPWWPWRRRPPAVRIDVATCVGCTFCALDCPYGAIHMQPRHAASRLLAVVDSSLCVGCAVCMGSCNDGAITVGELSLHELERKVAHALAPPRTALHFVCERRGAPAERRGASDASIAVPCIGAVPPDLVTRAFDQGAASVQMIGCPDGDCASREGNTWCEQRLTRRRNPRLSRDRSEYDVTLTWRESDMHNHAALGALRAALPVLVVVATLIAMQVALSDVRLPAAHPTDAQLRVALADVCRPFGPWSPHVHSADSVRLSLRVDGDERWQTTVAAPQCTREVAPVYAEIQLPPGTHQIALAYGSPGTQAQERLVYDANERLESGKVFTVDLGRILSNDARLRTAR